MFWRKSGRATSTGRPDKDREDQHEPIKIEPDAERPATIVRVATELERRGAEVVEFFKVISAPRGQAKIPIYLRWKDQDFFVEVETRRWNPSSTVDILEDVAVLRDSEYRAAGMGLLSAYPVPKDVDFFLGKHSAALFQLAFFNREDRGNPEALAASFVRAAQKALNAYVDYETNSLPQVENSLSDAIYNTPDTDSFEGRPPVLEALVEGLGYYLGEVVRRSSRLDGYWGDSKEWGEDPVLELGGFILDPVGKARAFLHNGPEDSIAYYAEYVLEALEDPAADYQARGLGVAPPEFPDYVGRIHQHFLAYGHYRYCPLPGKLYYFRTAVRVRVYRLVLQV